jgi:hypothetical protein
MLQMQCLLCPILVKSRMLRQILIKFYKLKLYDHLLGRCGSDTHRRPEQTTELTVVFRDYFANAPTNRLQSPNNEEESEGHGEDSVR